MHFNYIMERSNFCMERSNFDNGANWLLLGAKWPWGELTGYPYLGPYAVRTANIHCVLSYGAFTILKLGLYILISALGLRTPKSHALRTKNIYHVLCFGAFTFSERITLSHSPALGLPRALCIYISLLDSRTLTTKNIHRVFALWDISRFQNTFGNKEGMITWCWLAEHAFH